MMMVIVPWRSETIVFDLSYICGIHIQNGLMSGDTNRCELEMFTSPEANTNNIHHSLRVFQRDNDSISFPNV